MQRGAVLIAASVVVAAIVSPAGAQTQLSVYSMVCPPGLSVVATGKASAPYRCAKAAQQASAPASTSAPEKQASAEQGQASAAQPQKTDTAACKAFNAEFTPFYEESVRKYSEDGERQTDVADRLRGLIADAQTLSRKLKQQALQAGSPQMRRMLLQQARSVDQDIAAKQKMLSRLNTNSDLERAEWRTDYKQRFQEYLKKRPAGCKVAALSEEGGS